MREADVRVSEDDAPWAPSRYGVAPATAQRLEAAYHIDGELVDAPSSYRWPSPSVPGLELSAADCGVREAAAAVASATRANQAWADTPANERVRAVRRLAELIASRREELADLIAYESAKAMRYARAEVASVVLMLETLCGSTAELGGPARLDYTTGRRVTTVYRPIGVALVISPWNFPLSLGLRKVATALLAGCPVIWKPSDRSPLTALRAAELAADAGLPAGAVTVLPTGRSPEVVRHLLHSGPVRKLAFTGSTRTGMALMAEAAPQMVRTSLELGGNGPAIVGAGADVDVVVPHVLAAKFGGSGQVCTAINRLYVHESIRGAFVDAIRRALDDYVIGWPCDPDARIGPLITSSSVERVIRLVQDAARRGADVSEHGVVPDADWQFATPKVVDGAPQDSDLVQEEIFGPVLPIIAFAEIDEAVRLANDTPYGLASYVFSSDAHELEFAASRMRSGMVAVNSASPSSTSAPFGGIGWSGNGRENGVRGLHDYLDEITLQY